MNLPIKECPVSRHSFHSLLIATCTFMLFSACNWVYDDRSNCSDGTWLKLFYSYNLLNVDAISTQVNEVSIFAFDENNHFVSRIDIDSLALHQAHFKVKMNLPDGKYNFIIWSGLSDENFQCSPVAERNSLCISVACDSGRQQNQKLTPLFYGCIENVSISNQYQVLSVPLIKDTNSFSCLLQDKSNKILDKNDFLFVITSSNGHMDYQNLPTNASPVYYRPFHKETVELPGQNIVHTKLNTLRIMCDDDTQLSLKHLPSGQILMQIPLTQYLLLSRIQNGSLNIEAQEYLDRQDLYTLIFFLDSSNNDYPTITPTMNVNGWNVRLNLTELRPPQ